jgi:hypothetical protein
MADYSTRRPNRYDNGYEPSDEVSRPRDHASDPLAELARLIGKSEQFSNSARTDSRSVRQRFIASRRQMTGAVNRARGA